MDFSIQLIADKLGKSLEGLNDRLENELNQAVKDLSNAAYSAIVSQVQATQMDLKNRQDYLKGLQFTDLGQNVYMISLDGEWANKLEDGFGPYSIKDKLLKSQKVVKTGSRAGEKWVRTSNDGKKYAAVPFEKRMSQMKASGNLAEDIKKITASNLQGTKQKITSTFKDPSGNAISGKVAVGKSDNPMLDNITKYQHVSEKGKVSSIYMVYRMVSEDSQGWMHPGHSGYNFFAQLEQFVQNELENIVQTILE